MEVRINIRYLSKSYQKEQDLQEGEELSMIKYKEMFYTLSLNIHSFGRVFSLSLK